MTIGESAKGKFLSDGSIEEKTASQNWLANPFLWVAAALSGLACFLYYPLFFPSSHQAIALQSEEFFFEANEAAGAPVLVLSAWLFYRRSHYLDLLSGRGAPVASGLFLLGAVSLFGWGHFTQASDLQLASVIPLLVGAVLGLGGWPAMRAFWLPIVFIGFALPLPPVLLSAAIFPIQLFTAEYAGAILNFIGVKSLVQGDQILRPENTFIVIETCSGVRTIVTLSMLTILMIDLFERSGRHAAILFVLAPAVAFLSNGLRVVTLVLNPHSSIHSIHNLQGIVMLLVGLTGIYVLDLALERVFRSREALTESGEYGDIASAQTLGLAGMRPVRLAFISVALVGMLSIGLTVTPFKTPGGLAERPDDLLVRVFAESIRQSIKPDYQFRGSLRYLDHANRMVRFEGEPMEVFVGVGTETLREYTMLSKRLAWPESGWIPIEESIVELEGSDALVRRVLLRRGGRTALSYSLYLRSGGLMTEWFRQAAALDRSPFVRNKHMLAIRISTGVGRGVGEQERADELIRKAWARLAPELEEFAPMGAS